MYDVWRNSQKTGYVSGPGPGRGRGLRHRYDLPIKEAEEEKPAAEGVKQNSDQVETAADLIEEETPLVSTMGKAQLAALKELGS